LLHISHTDLSENMLQAPQANANQLECNKVG
jgi:hypothetical protein